MNQIWNVIIITHDALTEKSVINKTKIGYDKERNQWISYVIST